MVRYLYFDVANTLVVKNGIYEVFLNALRSSQVDVDIDRVRMAHRILTEASQFPDKTNKDFYDTFNTKFFAIFGIHASQSILKDVYEACSQIKWQVAEDLSFLKNYNLKLGIISNWDLSLKGFLSKHFDLEFDHIFCSQEVGLQKPCLQLYKMAIAGTGLLPEEILYIGDSFCLDYKPSHEIGMRGVLLDREDFYKENRALSKGSSIKEIVEKHVKFTSN